MPITIHDGLLLAHPLGSGVSHIVVDSIDGFGALADGRSGGSKRRPAPSGMGRMLLPTTRESIAISLDRVPVAASCGAVRGFESSLRTREETPISSA